MINLPVVDFHSQPREISAITKVTEYVTFGFSFRILFFFPFRKSLNVTVCKRYEVFSVLAATIRENFEKQPWIGKGEALLFICQTDGGARN